MSNDITLLDSDFEQLSEPIPLQRNFEIHGTHAEKENWPRLDLGFLREKVLLGAGVVLNFTQIVIDRMRKGPYFQTPGMDILAFAPRDPAMKYAFVVFWNTAHIQRTCLPDSLYRASTDTLKRPSELPGSQLADRVSQWTPCQTDTAAPAMQRCWPKLGKYDDIAVYGSDLVGPGGKLTYNNYIMWTYRMYYLCSTTMTEDCLRQNTLLGCYNVMFPPNGSGEDNRTATSLASSRAPAPSSATSAQADALQAQQPQSQQPQQQDASEGARGSGKKVPLGPLLGGLLGGMAGLAAVATVIVARRRRRSDAAAGGGGGGVSKLMWWQQLSATLGKDSGPASGASSTSCPKRGGEVDDGSSGRCQGGSSNKHQPPPPRPMHVSALRDPATSPYTTPTTAATCDIALCSVGYGGARGPQQTTPGSSCAAAATTGSDLGLPLAASSADLPTAGETDPGVGSCHHQHQHARDDNGDVLEPVTTHTPMQPGINLRISLKGGEVHLSSVLLGKGSFGRVVQGTYGGVRVAVKLINSGLGLGWGTAEVAAAEAVGKGPTAAGAAAAAAASIVETAEPDLREHQEGRQQGEQAAQLQQQGEQQGQQPAAVSAGGGVLASSFITSLAQEVEVLARCQHPNIVKLLAANLEPPHVCLVMELMDTSLDRMMYDNDGKGLMPLALVLHISMNIARALSYMHPTILHRDLKPANVLISQLHSPTPIVKLADFGLSRLRDTVLVTQNPEVGTAPYMAPETFDLENYVVTDRVDIFALGVIMWEMLAGRRPWGGYNAVQIAYCVAVQDARLPLEEMNEGRCPTKLREIIQGCWDPDPARRPAAAEIVKDLARLQEQASVAVPRPLPRLALPRMKANRGARATDR